MPFTQDQLLSLFERYNRAIEPAPFFAYALGALALVFACRGGRASGRIVLALLALFWIACGAGFQLAFFRRLNPAANAFGALFLVQAALLLGAALRREQRRQIEAGAVPAPSDEQSKSGPDPERGRPRLRAGRHAGC